MSTVRPRRPTDLPGCVQALWPVHLADGYPIHWPDDPAAWIDPPGLSAAWVAESDGEIVGHIGVVDGPDPFGIGSGATSVVTRLFIRPIARGTGLAAALLAAARLRARSSDRALLLEVIDGTPAVRTYERLGWRLQDIRRSTWTARDGLHRAVRVYLEPAI